MKILTQRNDNSGVIKAHSGGWLSAAVRQWRQTWVIGNQAGLGQGGNDLSGTRSVQKVKT